MLKLGHDNPGNEMGADKMTQIQIGRFPQNLTWYPTDADAKDCLWYNRPLLQQQQQKRPMLRRRG